MTDHLLPTLFQRPDKVDAPLYVVTPISNSRRYRTRWKHYEDFAKMCDDAGAILYTVEAAHGHRRHAITNTSDSRHIMVRTNHEYWLKENLINIGVQHLPSDWQYVAAVDADVQFVRHDWANETLHSLQYYKVVQMWSQLQDLTSNYELLWSNWSFAYVYLQWCGGYRPKPACPGEYPHPGHHGPPGPVPPGRLGSPGLAWAYTRDAWDTLGGLLDVCVLGSADWYMANGLIGRCREVLQDAENRKFHPAYRRRILEWEDRAKRLHRNVGVVPGLALHYFHGVRSGRKYGSRNKILVDTQFNPDIDIFRDWQGVYQLRPDAIQLRDCLRDYLASRNEDAL